MVWSINDVSQRDGPAETEAFVAPERAEHWPSHATLSKASPLQHFKKSQKLRALISPLHCYLSVFKKDPKHGAFIRRINLLRQSSWSARAAIKTKVVIIPGAPLAWSARI